MKWSGREKIDKKASVEELLQEYGGDILRDPRYQILATLKQHRCSNTMRHCIEVTKGCLKQAKFGRISVDVKSMVRGALLHDYYLYEYTSDRRKGHFHHHGEWAAQNAMKDFGLNDLENNMVCTHMWPISIFKFPRTREGFILTVQDKWVSFKEFFARKPSVKSQKQKDKQAAKEAKKKAAL
ncbi:MAG: hypothetical protein MJ239_02620 [Bacilli bacterium]|nr:hypothetical protein [Bacilli bacterium]